MNKNKRGFTLVELLATIVMLALVVGVIIYTAVSLIGKSKKSSYEVTINNIKVNATDYIKERNFFYITKDDETEYQCITIENLIDYGYLNNNMIGTSKVSEDETLAKEDYIYIERNRKTKAVTKTEYVKKNGTNETCETAMKALGDIYIKAEPSFEVWSKSKKITIVYRLNNLNDMKNITDYNYDYKYISGENTLNNKTNNFNKTDATETFEITKNGTIKANIYTDPVTGEEKTIDKIDTEEPIISLVNTEGGTVKQMVLIPIKVTDNGSGVKSDSFKADDLNIKIGNEKPTKIKLTKKSCNKGSTACLYNLLIEDFIHEGNLTITIDEDKVQDNIDNGNQPTTLNTNITFNNTYTIYYNLNGGTETIVNPLTYNVNTPDIIINNPTKTGHVLDALYEKKYNLSWQQGFLNYTTGEVELDNKTYPNSYYSELISVRKGKTYLATGIGNYDKSKIRWRAYDANGNYLGNKSSNDTLTPTEDYYIRLLYFENPSADHRKNTVINVSGNDTISDFRWEKGFLNYTTGEIEKNNTTYPNSYYTNQFLVKSGSTYTISGIGSYDTSKIRWRAYDGSGNYLGTMSSNNILKAESDYYVRILYYMNPTGTQMKGTVVSTTTKTIPQGSMGNEWYNAMWTPKTITVTFDCNGGTGGGTNNYTYGLTGQSFPNPSLCSKTGYNGNNWSAPNGNTYTWTSGVADSWINNVYDNKYGNTNHVITLTANWTPKTVTVTFYKNTSTTDTTTASQAFTYGNAYNSTTQKGNRFGYNLDGTPRWTQTGQFGQWDRSGYTLLGWSKSRSATEQTYSTYSTVTDNWINNNSPSINLYAVWKSNSCGYYCTYGCTDGTCCYCNGAPADTGGGCFLAGTKVVTNKGNVDINKIKVGDMVLTYNEGTSNKEYHKVTKLHAYNPNEINERLYTLTFDDRTTLKVSSTHRFYIMRNNQNYWLPTKDIKTGDIVIYINNAKHKIINIRNEELTQTVYNLTIENTHNYYVGNQGILVHNIPICGDNPGDGAAGGYTGHSGCK